MPAMPLQFGPPSQFALKVKPYLGLILVLQSVEAVLRLCLFLDFTGAFLMFMGVAVGVLAYSRQLDITLICYYGLICLINGTFDFVRLLDLWANYGAYLEVGVLQTLTMFLTPLVELVGALIAYILYRDNGDFQEDSGFLNEVQAQPSEREPLFPRAARGERLPKFSGEGHRLAEDV